MKLIFWDGGSVKPHLVSNALEKAIKGDIKKRFPLTSVFMEKDRGDELFRIDLGGMMMLDAEWVGVDLEGTNFEVPVRDIEHFYMKLLDTRLERNFDGQAYYKLHGWIHCVVITPEQRKTLLKEWGDKLQEYQDKAEKEQAVFTAKVIELNKHPNLELSVPRPKKALKKKDIN